MGMNDFTKPPSSNVPPTGTSIPQMPSMTPPINTNDIKDTFINYNTKFKNKDSVMFREKVIEQLLSILISKNKPNGLLIGSAGVGKTAIVEELAKMIENNDPRIPTQLAKTTIYELPLSNLVAGTGIVGALETKMEELVNFAESEDCILFIDEIHQVMSSTENHDSYGKIAQILKPALARGDIKVIGATTLQEASTLSNDPAFNRRFSRLLVDELTHDQTVEILKKVKVELIHHYENKINIDDSMLPTLVRIADQYNQAGSHRPDNAITLLDRTCSNMIVKHKSAIAIAENSNNTQLINALKAQKVLPINEQTMKKTAVKLITGNAKQEAVDKNEFKDALSVIKGQDNIIDSIIKHMENRENNLFPKNKPLTLLFAGNSGVGKTEITKILANILTKSKPIILNMTEFNSPASINRIIGAPAGYVGYGTNNELPFDELETNPYKIILLDEFEKGDKAIQRLFMSAFDEGTIKTATGKTIDFSKSIIIATTNAGHTNNERTTLGFTDTNNTNPSKQKATMVERLSNWFDLELLNRFTEILKFNDITRENYIDILQNIYIKEAKRINEQFTKIQLNDKLTDDELNELADKSFVPTFNARPAYQTVKEYIESQV